MAQSTEKTTKAAEKTYNPQDVILVVDDEVRLGRFISMLLKQSGYPAITCQSVAEARAVLITQTCQLVITDIFMPIESGFDLMRWVADHCPQVPVIAMTAYSTEAVEDEIFAAGFATILQKPFLIDAFYQMVQQILSPQLGSV